MLVRYLHPVEREGDMNLHVPGMTTDQEPME